ncbi:hypothetical protein [Chryseobacterium sp. ISL-6]|uniref:hypothetical protein n=1 Tax=Chryseobacterium sp. ISL-6 TaxID=2819143 RepID=UPI001BEC871E|nr:hypothetical protein [Chryseobacterium sp. ISL-6]MBT2621242.1 hypothetical protein [Chryseobacterium sp. ISL-6]
MFPAIRSFTYRKAQNYFNQQNLTELLTIGKIENGKGWKRRPDHRIQNPEKKTGRKSAQKNKSP